MTHERAKRAQIKAISRALANLSVVITATSGIFLILAPPIDWKLVGGVLVGVGMYVAAELLIPFYVERD
jgi:hypothetical protein